LTALIYFDKMDTGLCLALLNQGVATSEYWFVVMRRIKMEALILQSLLGRESARKKPTTGSAINNAQQRNFHLPCRGQRAIFSPPAVRLRNQTTPTGCSIYYSMNKINYANNYGNDFQDDQIKIVKMCRINICTKDPLQIV
ncbi:hypothetical protein T4E_2971, partial [Trichinella pseudospiralis]